MRRETGFHKILSTLLLALGCALCLPCAAAFAQQTATQTSTQATQNATQSTTPARAQADARRDAAATATASISGRVTDAQGAAVPGASVTLYARDARPAARLSTVTDADGAYRFERLAAPGEYILEVEAEGFARAAARVLRLERGGAIMLDVPLEVSGVRAEVVVTASDTPQTVDEVSKAVTVVGRGEMDERDEATIAEALRTVPGLRVQQLGGPGAFTSIKTRGLRNQDTALLIDGLRFRDPSSPQADASGFLSDFLVTDTSRVEVLRGSGSSLYGTNAIGGVVNVVTEEGGGPFHGNLLAEGGGLGQFRGRAQIAGGAGVADRFVYSAAVSHLNVTRGLDGDDAARNTNAQGRALFRLTPNATLSGRVYASDSFLQLNENPLGVNTATATTNGGIIDARPVSEAELRRFEAGTPAAALNTASANFIPGSNDPDNSRATRFLAGALTLAGRLNEDLGYSLTYQGLATRGRFDDGPAGVFFEPAGAQRSDFEGRVHTLNARADFRLGRHQLFNVGYEFEHEGFFNRTLMPNPAADSSVGVTERSHAVFAQDQLRFLDDRLQLSAGFRAQFFSLRAPRFTPTTGAPYAGATVAPPNAYTGDGSVSYLFRSTGAKLRAHVGNGYRAPSLFERFGTSFDAFFGYSVYGDPALRPERSIAADAGLDQSFADNRLRASATYFYTRLQEVILFDFSGGINPTTDPFGRFIGYRNAGGGLARGVELSLSAAPARTLNLFASYTYTNSDQRTPQVGSTLRALGIPDHQFSLVATQRIGQRFFFNFDLSATSDYLVGSIFDVQTFANPVFRFDGNIKADLGASYTLPLARARSLRFFGKIENLLDRENFENGFRTPRRTGLAGAAYSF